MIGPAKSVVLLGTVLALSGCAYDYLQRTDRVAYSAGDAVKANLEQETTNPTDKARYSKSGLGRNGDVIPADPDATGG